MHNDFTKDPMKIENYTALNKGKLLAGFDLTLPSGFTFIGMKLFNGPNGHFVGFPERAYQSNGETKYSKIITIPDREKSDKFNTMVVDALRTAGHLN